MIFLILQVCGTDLIDINAKCKLIWYTEHLQNSNSNSKVTVMNECASFIVICYMSVLLRKQSTNWHIMFFAGCVRLALALVSLTFTCIHTVYHTTACPDHCSRPLCVTYEVCAVLCVPCIWEEADNRNRAWKGDKMTLNLMTSEMTVDELVNNKYVAPNKILHKMIK